MPHLPCESDGQLVNPEWVYEVRNSAGYNTRHPGMTEERPEGPSRVGAIGHVPDAVTDGVTDDRSAVRP